MASKLRIPGRRALHLAVEGARRRGAARLAAEVREARATVIEGDREKRDMAAQIDALQRNVVDIQREQVAARAAEKLEKSDARR